MWDVCEWGFQLCVGAAALVGAAVALGGVGLCGILARSRRDDLFARRREWELDRDDRAREAEARLRRRAAEIAEEAAVALGLCPISRPDEFRKLEASCRWALRDQQARKK